jgi:hypothetical protein|nr:MAG TPA: hypothetical protein [Caudoviricetes sp.]
MRKIKKINGYLVVRFNDRELREYDGTALGNYGVIDAELYTGNLDIDRGSMEYDNAGSLEEAVELARNLESECDITEGLATYTVVKETDDSTFETEVDPQILREGFKSELEIKIKSPRYPDVNPATARHELYGYLVALKELGIIDPDGCDVEPDYFGPEKETPPYCDLLSDISPAEWVELRHSVDEQVAVAHADFIAKSATFENLSPEKRFSGTARQVYALGLALEKDCPESDCRLYLNIFNQCREIDSAINNVKGWPQKLLDMELKRGYLKLEGMFALNYAIREYRKSKKKEPPEERATPQDGNLNKVNKLMQEIDDYSNENLTPYYPGKPGPSAYISGRFAHDKRE